MEFFLDMGSSSHLVIAPAKRQTGIIFGCRFDFLYNNGVLIVLDSNGYTQHKFHDKMGTNS